MAKHVFEKDENGDVDLWAFEDDYHNGPYCIVCDGYFCELCDQDIWEDCPARTETLPGLDYDDL